MTTISVPQPKPEVQRGGASSKFRPAQATAQISPEGQVTQIKITYRGHAYSTTPTVLLIGSHQKQAKAVATLSRGRVASITIVDSGSGYTVAPQVIFESPEVGQGARAQSVIQAGQLVEMRINQAGYGYRKPPLVKIVGGDYDVRAEGHAQIKDGSVTNLVVDNPGSDYRRPPCIYLIPDYSSQKDDLDPRIIRWLKNHEKRVLKEIRSLKTQPPPVPQPKQLSPKEIKQQAQQFDQVIAQRERTRRKKYKQALAKLQKIRKIRQEDQALAQEAQQLGLPPPPSHYTKKEMNQLNKALEKYRPKPRPKLNPAEKAYCLRIRQEALQAQAGLTVIQAQGTGGQSVQTASELSDQADRLWKIYDQKCV